MITESVHGANLVDIVYGGGVPDLGDPSEEFFEASKLQRELIGWQAPGVRLLQNTPDLYPIVARAGRRFASRPGVSLTPAPRADRQLDDVLRQRRSADAFGDDPMSLSTLSGLLSLSYGVRPGTGEGTAMPPLRPAPSAGALYPLDIYVATQRVDGVRVGLHHADMACERLVHLHDVDLKSLAAASMQPELTASAGAVVVIAASIWRSRVKYSQRALRFALMEAGHVVQNMLLVAESYGLGARALGGFCDDEVNQLVGLQGVDEFALYLVVVGSSPASASS